MKRQVSTKTALEPYGLITISGEVERNRDFDGYQQEPYEPPFDVYSLIVMCGRHEIVSEMDMCEIEKCKEVLIEKFIDDEQAYRDTLIDEAIERSRSFARNAYA